MSCARRAPWRLGRYYQIYNPTSAAIDLSGYSLASCVNGCSSDGVFEYGYNYPAGATIAAGGTYTVCNSGLTGNLSSCDEVLSWPQVSFNGDDFQALVSSADYTTATALDIIDTMGLFSTTDPGSYWPVCGTSSGLDTRNGLLTRASTTCCGDNQGAAFEDSFSGTCEWTETDQVTTPATWTTTTDCSSVVCPGPPTATPTVSTAPTATMLFTTTGDCTSSGSCFTSPNYPSSCACAHYRQRARVAGGVYCFF